MVNSFTKDLLVATILVGTNEKHWLSNALKTIEESSLISNIIIIYVDNNSSDGSVGYVKSHFPNIKIIENSVNLGFAAANNKGIELATSLHADYFFFVNPDTHTPKGLINKLVNFMEDNLDFGAVGPMQLNYEPLKNGSYEINEWSKQVLVNGERDVFYMDLMDYKIDSKTGIKNNKLPNVIEHSYVQGAALLVRNNLTGFKIKFDTNYHTFYEEIDLCRKIRWLGYRVGLIKDLFMHHKGGGSTNQSNYKKILMMRNKYYYILTEPTWQLRYILIIISRWVINDIGTLWPKRMGIFVRSLFFLVSRIPKILTIRCENAKLSNYMKIKITKIR